MITGLSIGTQGYISSGSLINYLNEDVSINISSESDINVSILDEKIISISIEDT